MDIKGLNIWQPTFSLRAEHNVPTKLVFTKRGSKIKLHFSGSQTNKRIANAHVLRMPQGFQQLSRKKNPFFTHKFMK